MTYQPTISDIPPASMTTPFTRKEIEKAIKQLRDNKSAGIETLKPEEQLKKGPSFIYREIAKILNIMAAHRGD